MSKNKVLAFVLLVLAISNVTVSRAEQRQLAQVVYITLSKACSCTLVLCQAGDIIVGNVFSGERKGLLKRIDYSTDKEAARVYLKQYGITQAPAILFLDTQGKLLWMALGELSEKDIQEKLRVLGN
ncbi:MAG: hypothetical protein Q8L00_10035 [Deltaproteobacteria bacterium]|nr:hypothetical protein [Deltaproteobacteria bacterium]